MDGNYLDRLNRGRQEGDEDSRRETRRLRLAERHTERGGGKTVRQGLDQSRCSQCHGRPHVPAAVCVCVCAAVSGCVRLSLFGVFVFGVCMMGNTESMESQLAVIRSRAAPVRLPMPDPAELEERFSIALVSPQQIHKTHTHYMYTTAERNVIYSGESTTQQTHTKTKISHKMEIYYKSDVDSTVSTGLM